MEDRRAARELVESIRKRRGYLPPEVYDGMVEENRQAIQSAFKGLSEEFGGSIVTLAEKIYSSKARFVFELLQNCDDNHYCGARSRREDPFVCFRVFSDRIIMISNENGFTPDDLRAICSVGKSSKLGAQGYIGEKGIGFKSVFMAAYKVRIQSGDFSFSFEHREGDIGLGMITPKWEEERDSRVPNHWSQFTLYLHEEPETSPNDVSLRQSIRQQFYDIHDAILLFMKNIRWVKVAFCDADGSEESSTIHTITWHSNIKVTANKVVEDQGVSTTTSNHYIVVRNTAQNLSPNENRIYSEEEKSNQAYSRSEIVLAFPLDQDSSPLLDKQYVFAFLPVRKTGFKFLIQADFVTDASRQDIVTDSQRNIGLGTGIADAFIEAVRQFSKRDPLRWQWMRYIPQKNEHAWDGIWTGVIDQIGERLERTRILQLDGAPPLQFLSNCFGHMTSILDKRGKFLLPDQFPKRCVSLKYEQSDLALLKPYGFKDVDIVTCVELLEKDLKSSSSTYKTTLDDDWHSRFARLLHNPFAEGWTNIQKRIKQLLIVPLRWGGGFSSVLEINGSTETIRRIYYPLVAGDTGFDLYVPGKLGLCVVDEDATRNAERRRLFDAMGVQSASVDFVRNAIIQIYESAGTGTYGLPEHLHFLYRTHDIAKAPIEYREIQILSNCCNALSTFDYDFYIHDKQDPYGASELLRTIETDPANSSRLAAYFVNNVYFEGAPKKLAAQSLTWKEWLHEHFQVQRYPRLVDPDGSKLSLIAEYVAKHRPEKFIGFVQNVWSREVGGLAEPLERNIIEQLHGMNVLCADGRKYVLRSTFLPTKKFKRLCGRFMPEQMYPWLYVKLDNDYLPASWQSFIEAIWPAEKVSEYLEIKFVLNVLMVLMKRHPDAAKIADPQRICHLYIFLQTGVSRSSDPDQCRQLIRQWFNEHDGIYIPNCEIGNAAWTSRLRCVWNSPFALRRFHSLSRIYEQAFDSSADSKAYLAGFFSTTLEIPDSSWVDYLYEVRLFNLQYAGDFKEIANIFGHLAKEVISEDEEARLKEKLGKEAYIAGYDGAKPAWFKSTECLWSSPTRIGGMLTLNELYPGLGDFFVKRIGVQRVTPLLIYKKMLHEELSVEDAKQTILTFNGFLADRKNEQLKAEPVQERSILPLRMPSGNVQLAKCSDEFALLDRQSLGYDFARKAKILDLSVDDIRVLKPFFAWLGLEDRYLSKLVQEITRVDAESTRCVSTPHRRINSKAHALLSVALAYNSPRIRQGSLTLYRLLRNSQTLETESITSKLRLEQDGNVLMVEKATATLHIDNTDPNVLKIYVPKNEASQEFCFSSKLPQQFCEWLMTDTSTKVAERVPTEAVSAIKSVLAVKPIALLDVLDYHGIEPAHAPPDSEQQSESETLIANSSGAGDFDLSGSGSGSYMSSIGYGSRYQETDRNDHGDLASYRYLLVTVVEAAKNIKFPAYDPFNMYTLQAVLSNSSVGATTWTLNPSASVYGHDRERGIGAAGELFVFELLSHLQPGLPNFNHQNWESNIRHYANLHPDYQYLQNWGGSETSDITYMDSDSVLTTLLIQKGYLDGRTWRGAKLKYFIEVKTTTGACNTPFFVSPNQYARMQELSYSNATRKNTNGMYVIFRVFNLGREDCGLRVLVDPEDLRQKEILNFSAGPWTVVTK